ncbi:hypothetical protein Phou_003490 [Phytohabitans houttuyneae]|uniref:Uncharacterized protein n=1 Tax=Phytohabitans houttuyneae TaxID=1076126 RepID=A0A6V8K1X2_9ACTN|nr:hypothetical protein Phou_003490 [Phytohabitans houttuyneae]
MTAPLLPLRVVFHALVIVAPDGRVIATRQPLVPLEPAVTRTVATKPPVHELSDTVAVQPPVPGGGVVTGGEC